MTMSKFKLIAIALAFAGSLISGALVFTAPTGARVLAQGALLECGYNANPNTTTQPTACTLCDFFSLINTVVQYLFGIVGSLTLLGMISGGIMYIAGPSIGGGEQFGLERAKKIILTSLVGFILITSSWLIIRTVAFFAGYTNGIADLTTIKCSNSGQGEKTPLQELQDEVAHPQ